MLEAVPGGAIGIMPGVPIADLLQAVFEYLQSGQGQSAYKTFASVLPYIAFTLQNFELFLQMEKQLLVRRNIFRSAICRSATWNPDDDITKHISVLIDHVMQTLHDGGFEK